MINNVNAYVIIHAGIDIILKHLAYVPFFLALSYSLLSSNILDYEINEHNMSRCFNKYIEYKHVHIYTCIYIYMYR